MISPAFELRAYWYIYGIIIVWVKGFAIFWMYVLVCGLYITWSKQFKQWEIHSLWFLGSIVIDSALTRYVSSCAIDITQMNVHCNLVTLWSGCAKQTIFLFVGAKPNKGLNSRSRRDRKWARERQSERSWKKEPTERIGEGWRRRAVRSRQRSAEGSSEGRPVRMSWHSS